MPATSPARFGSARRAGRSSRCRSGSIRIRPCQIRPTSCRDRSTPTGPCRPLSAVSRWPGAGSPRQGGDARRQGTRRPGDHRWLGCWWDQPGGSKNRCPRRSSSVVEQGTHMPADPGTATALLRNGTRRSPPGTGLPRDRAMRRCRRARDVIVPDLAQVYGRSRPAACLVGLGSAEVDSSRKVRIALATWTASSSQSMWPASGTMFSSAFGSRATTCFA